MHTTRINNEVKAMERRTNTDKDGHAWPEATRVLVWEKGDPIPNYPEDIWRVDRYGSVIQYAEYGNRDSKFGWVIDHIVSVSKDNLDEMHNLQPLHWVNNLTQRDKRQRRCG
jgi:hypothetical protein